jgi:phage-related protein
MDQPNSKSVVWIGSSKEDLRSFPSEVQRVMGFALRAAQNGGKHPEAKPMKGFKGAGVLEIVEDHYTVRLSDAVYVLHAFQKKSKKGIATPKQDLDLIRGRLKQAETIHAERMKGGPP